MSPEAPVPEWFTQLGVMAWPLAACSVLAVMLYLERGVFYLRAWAGRERTYARLADTLTLHRGHAKPVRDEMVGVMLRELQGRYDHGLKFLRMIGTLSPLLGLLGTILGIIAAFQVIATHTAPVTPNMIADGLWEAMLTTAAGLCIALPCLLMAHLYRALGEHLLESYCLRLNKLSLSFEMEKALAPDTPATPHPRDAQARERRVA